MPLVMMTDDRDADWAGAVRRLPRGSVVVVRARDAGARLRLAEDLLGLAPLLIADDPVLAEDIGAAGLHLPQRRMRAALHWRARHPDWIITAAAHDMRAFLHVQGLDALFLSPVFTTASHPGAPALSPVRAGLMAAQAMVPVYALGGVTGQTVARLPPGFSGLAAIGSLL